jgi:penicillin-binding protein 1A
VIEEAKARSYKVLSDYVAAQMVDMMRGTVEYGTAVRARALGRELAGKTGTVNDFTDAWFIGYTPSYVCGTWIGFDEKRSLGKGETGGSAALPFWIDFMENFLKEKPKERFGPLPDMPDDLKEAQVARIKEHAAERARQAAASGDVLPGTGEVPNLDPLGETSSPRPTPTVEKPAPTPTPTPVVPKIVKPTPEVKPPKPEEKEKKGKKGKVDNDTSNWVPGALGSEL